MTALDADDMERIVDRVLSRALEPAIARALEVLGVDITDADQRQSARMDFSYLHRARVRSENALAWGLRTLVGTSVTAGLYLLWQGVQARVNPP